MAQNQLHGQLHGLIVSGIGAYIPRMIDTRPGKTRAFQHPGPSHTGRRAASRRMPRGIWPRVRAGHCDSCIVRISSVHFRTSASLTRNMISVRTLDLADPLCRRGEKHYYIDTTVCIQGGPIIRYPRNIRVLELYYGFSTTLRSICIRVCLTM